MNEQEDKHISEKIRLSLQNFKEEHYRQFNTAFTFMTIIPFLIFLYLLVTQLFSIEIVIGNIGLILAITFLLALLGYCVGYSMIRNLLEKIISLIEKTESSHLKLRKTQIMLIQAEKFKAIGQLASGIAHEVKNPLGILLQDVIYLEENISPEKDVSNVLDMMKRNLKRANDITHTLLDFSRVSKLDISPRNINLIIENSLVLVQRKVELKNLKFVKEFKKDLPKVLVDNVKIEQVFVNVLLNAIQAMPDGGTLYIRSNQAQLSKAGNRVGRRNGDYFEVGEMAVAVEIEDTGAGVSETDLTRIFEPFFTTKEVGKGTGLGLSIVKNIIDIHRGIIEIESKEGRGTKVTIKLKISGPMKAEPQEEKEVKEEKKKIMIVDDEQDFLDITKLNLEKTGKYEVLTLLSAKDIISQLHSFRPDVILLDILMPEIDGLETCGVLNKDYAGKDIPIIILSALGTYSDKLKAFKAGVVDYLQKPVTKDALIVKIEKAVQSKDMMNPMNPDVLGNSL